MKVLVNFVVSYVCCWPLIYGMLYGHSVLCALIWLTCSVSAWLVGTAASRRVEWQRMPLFFRLSLCACGPAGVVSSLFSSGYHGLAWRPPTRAERWANFQQKFPTLARFSTVEDFDA